MLLYAVRRKYFRSKGNEGFTLVEMIAAVIIVGVIASIAAPNLLGMFNQTRVKDGLGQIEAAIKEAQKLAKRQGKTCIVSLGSRVVDGQQYAIAEVAPNVAEANGNAVDSSGCLLNLRELEREVVLEFDGDLADDGNVAVGVDSTTPVYVLFTSKGNTTDTANVFEDGSGNAVPNGASGIIVVAHPNVNQKKCVQIAGVLGNILTGDYIDTNNDGTPDFCDPT